MRAYPANRSNEVFVPMRNNPQQRNNDMNLRMSLLGLLAAAAVATAACGGNNDRATISADPSTPAAAPAGSNVAVKVADSPLGKILISTSGTTLYGFANDTAAKSTCYGACANAWPPVIVADDWAVGPGLDSGVFSTITRDDGAQQLVAGKFPLYEYAGDARPGDTNGQGSGDVWFVVGTDAKFITTKGTNQTAQPATPPTTAKPAPAPTVAASVKLADSPLGKIMVDAEGRTLYAFTKDANGSPTCTDACAKAWPASSLTGQPIAGSGIAAPLRSVTSPAGGTMIVAGKWPLYRFAGDAAPGDTNGQGSGGVWFAVAADGTLIK
jgi:predicted lipoprotein with Yx(FWY)xxD motif